jgi:hypothetical protein
MKYACLFEAASSVSPLVTLPVFLIILTRVNWVTSINLRRKFKVLRTIRSLLQRSSKARQNADGMGNRHVFIPRHEVEHTSVAGGCVIHERIFREVSSCRHRLQHGSGKVQTGDVKNSVKSSSLPLLTTMCAFCHPCLRRRLCPQWQWQLCQ